MIKITIEENGHTTTYQSESAIRSIELWDGTAWGFGRRPETFAELARTTGHVVTEVCVDGEMVDLTHVVKTDGAPIDVGALGEYFIGTGRPSELSKMFNDVAFSSGRDQMRVPE